MFASYRRSSYSALQFRARGWPFYSQRTALHVETFTAAAVDTPAAALPAQATVLCLKMWLGSVSHYNDACKQVSVCELLRIENIGPPCAGNWQRGAQGALQVSGPTAGVPVGLATMPPDTTLPKAGGRAAGAVGQGTVLR